MIEAFKSSANDLKAQRVACHLACHLAMEAKNLEIASQHERISPLILERDATAVDLDNSTIEVRGLARQVENLNDECRQL